MPVIDVHTHWVPQFVMDEASRGEFMGLTEEDGWLIHPDGYRFDVTPDFLDVDARLAGMDATGIDVSVLSSSPTFFFYELPAEEFIPFVKRSNDALAEVVKGQDRLEGFATLPLQAPEEAAAELERSVNELGLVGAQIGTGFDQNQRALDDPELDVVMETANRLGVPLLLHPYFDRLDPLIQDFFMTVTVGIPLDTTIAAARMLSSGIFDKHENLKFILCHGGGFLPYQLGRIEQAFRARPHLTSNTGKSPSTYLDHFYFDTLTHSDEALAFLVDLIGTDRLVLGTDIPFDMGDLQPLDRIGRVNVDPQLLGNNAAKLVGLE